MTTYPSTLLTSYNHVDYDRVVSTNFQTVSISPPCVTSIGHIYSTRFISDPYREPPPTVAKEKNKPWYGQFDKKRFK